MPVASLGQVSCVYLPRRLERLPPPKFVQRALLITVVRASKQSCTLFDFSDQLIPYEEAWQWQRSHVQQMIHHLDTPEGQAAPDQGALDAILLLQHPPVFTLGSGSTLTNLRFNPADPPAPLFRTERGGEVTAHSPGQLVAYPLLNLRNHQQDLHWYLRSLEEIIIRCLHEVGGVNAGRVPGMTGVWVEDAKIAAIGVRVSKWITYHGLALNVSNNLSFFDHIVPCGLQGKSVTSLSQLLARQESLAPVGTNSDLHVRPSRPQSSEMLMRETAHALMSAFTDVFDVNIGFSPCKTWSDMQAFLVSNAPSRPRLRLQPHVS